jgi:hypothetical protein
MSASHASIFPLIRFFSRPVTGALMRLPVSANQATAASLVLGLGAAWAAAEATQAWALAAFDVLWVLLPAGAIGAQVYWLTALVKRAREFHV